MRRLFAIIVAAIAFVGCSMDDITVSYQTDKSDIYYASFEDFGEESRTYVDENVKLLWHEDDRISLFRTTLNEQFKFTGATGDNSGGFSAIPSDEWVTGNVVSTNYAVYPYDATTKLSNDEIIQLTMPAVQHYAENSFGRGANTMVAASENTSSKFLPFRNLGGYIIVKLYGEDTTIKSIEFKGNNEEIIAGAATAEAKYGYLPVVTMLENGTTTITLDCGEEGVTISSDSANPTSFWFVVPPITFEGGFTFTITDINGNTFTKSTTKSQTVVRNVVKSMSGFEPTFEGEGEDPEVAPKPANNEIWYTNGSTTEATTPYKTDVFGANIVSNTYDADKECWVIKFDDDVTSIGNYAFYDCDSLTSVTIPDSVTEIVNNPFFGCTNLKKFEGKFAANNGRCLINDNVIIAYAEASGIEYTIPDSVTNIGDWAFIECTSLTNVTIPDSVTSIGNSAFYGCTSLTSITIPDSVTTIGDYAFYYCESLTSVTIGNSVTTIGNEAFAYCRSLTSVTIPDSVTKIKSNPFSYCKNLAKFEGKFAANNGRCLINDNVIIAYAEASGIEYTIPDSVTSIGNSAFYGCTSLTSITIPDSVTTIGYGAFCDCDSLTSVTIGNSVTTIGYGAFCDCDSLTSVTIGNSVTTIGDYAFYYCDSLTSVTISDSVKTIGDEAFSSCNNLTSVTISDSVTTIGRAAFNSCNSLTSVTIPDSVTTIGGWVFSDCTSLIDVYCKPTIPPTGGYDMFGSNASGRKIYVPSASVSAYKSASYWSTYSSDIIGYDFE